MLLHEGGDRAVKPDAMRKTTPPSPVTPDMVKDCARCGHQAEAHYNKQIDQPCHHCNAYGGLCEGAPQ